MASSIAAVLAFTASLILTAMAGDCDGYYDSFGNYQRPQYCGTMYCCGTCKNRSCCPSSFLKFDDDTCKDYRNTIYINFAAPIAVGVVILISTITLIIVCCVCPCCCLYKMCRKPKPVVATTTTTVVTQFPQQQPPNPAAQNPPYQPISAQPGYPVQPGYGTPAPYQGQPYAPGPPPPYQESGGYPSTDSQAAYDATQPPDPLNPLSKVQADYAHPPPQPDPNAAQPPYNPAYVEPPKTGY
ncbi:protein shisa-5-like [Clarias gariepinus]|uniref:protein shisa-5-like n=1 Tax=Clarias gariepinus TaxID=13013 RepID=UPI00234C7E2C|nr:protein shisa-5-like [Clarias gariepinus]